MFLSHPRARTVRAAGLVLVLLAPAARAQAPALGGDEVRVALDPVLPVAGLPVSAVVSFATLRPQNVTVFFRTVGTADFQSVAALPVGEPGVFRVVLPVDVPEPGLDVFAQYVVDGQTQTSPPVRPEENPFRVPSLIPISESTIALPARQYRMVTVPLVLVSGLPEGTQIALGSDEPDDVFGDDFGPGADPARWRLLRFDPVRERAVDYTEDRGGFGPVRPGEGYWLVTAAGGAFDVETGLSTGAAFDGPTPFPSPVRVSLGPGWNQIGNPFLFEVAWDDVVQRPDDVRAGGALVEDPVAFRGAYEPAQATLLPWEGYFVFNRGASTVLVFDALPIPDGGGGGKERPAERLLRRAGAGGYVLDVRAEAGPSADHVYLGVAAAAGDRLDARKPPPIDRGLRLVVRDEDHALAGSFRAPAAAQAWTLDLAPGDAREAPTLVLAEHGARPAGSHLSVDDLDRGVALPIVGGRVSVPPVPGSAVRHLRVRLDGAPSAAPALAVGRPYPVPTTDGVTVPYVLPAAGIVRVAVYDVLGRLVRVLTDGPLDGGPHDARWDGRDASGRRVASGAYVVRLGTAAASAAARVTVLH